MTLYELILTMTLQLMRLPATVVEQADVDMEASCANYPVAHACEIASDIIIEVSKADGAPFVGPARHDAAAIALLTIAHHESGFRRDVEDCSICRPGSDWCGGGKSISMYQLESSSWGGFARKEICASNQLATELALRAMALVGKWSPSSMFYSYAGCKGPAVDCRQHGELFGQFNRLTNRVGVVGRPACGQMFFRRRGTAPSLGHECDPD